MLSSVSDQNIVRELVCCGDYHHPMPSRGIKANLPKALDDGKFALIPREGLMCIHHCFDSSDHHQYVV
eukprot:360477-Chlamydomonas_euryale.AAC.2